MKENKILPQGSHCGKGKLKHLAAAGLAVLLGRMGMLWDAPRLKGLGELRHLRFQTKFSSRKGPARPKSAPTPLLEELQ